MRAYVRCSCDLSRIFGSGHTGGIDLPGARAQTTKGGKRAAGGRPACVQGAATGCSAWSIDNSERPQGRTCMQQGAVRGRYGPIYLDYVKATIVPSHGPVEK